LCSAPPLFAIKERVKKRWVCFTLAIAANYKHKNAKCMGKKAGKAIKVKK
jgi:hypothetical protein